MHLESEKDRNVTKRVGKTPLIKLEKLFEQQEVYAKLEWCNPSGSLKARPAAWMLHDSEKDGKITPNKTTIIEPTSGNTGVALSYFAKELGYKIDLTVPERISDETKKILRDQGANVMETEDDLCPRVGPGTDQAIALADALLKNHPDRYFSPNQYQNESNFRSHYTATGPEIWKETDGIIRTFITGIGTGGTITGVGTYLKEKNPDIKIIAIEPQKNHHIQGLRNLEESERPELLKRREGVIDKSIEVNDDESFDMIKKLYEKENILAGPSSGAVLAALNKVRAEIETPVVLIFGDNGEKYKSVYTKFNVFTEEEYDNNMKNSEYLSTN